MYLHGYIQEGDYVDLALVPERYTGYSGNSAHRVWRAIYEENCFGLSELNVPTGKSAAAVTLPDTLTNVLRERLDGEDTDGECLEKRVYYKIISGTSYTSMDVFILTPYRASRINFDTYMYRVAESVDW